MCVVPLTVIFTWSVVSGRERDFERWAQGIATAATRYPGHQGATWFRPASGSSDYRTVLRFSNAEAFARWERSEERATWLRQATPFIRAHTIQRTGLESWFSVPGQPALPPPPRWKMWLTTLAAVYPLSLAMQLILLPHVAAWPLVVRTAITSLALVSALSYLVMPRLTALLRPWLYPP